jgi:hypothetical protein
MTTIQQNLASSCPLVCSVQRRAEASVETFLISEDEVESPSTFYDSDIYQNTNSSSWNEFDVVVPFMSSATISLLSGASTLTNGRVAPLGNGGVSRIQVLDGNVSNILRLDTTKRGGSTYREFLDYAAGSVSEYLRDQVEALFVEDPDTNYFSTYSHGTATYTRNSSCWAADIDLSAIAVATNSGSGWTRQRGGTLITPRHVLLAAHYGLTVGSQVRFAGPDGTVETRTVTGVASNTGFGDTLIAVLSSNVTVAEPLKIPSDTWFEQGVDISGLTRSSFIGGAAIHIDQFARVYACGIGSTVNKQSSYAPNVSYDGTDYLSCPVVAWASHSQEVFTGGIPSPIKIPVSGDSGQPLMALINGDPVLLFCWLYSSAGPPTWRHNGAVLNALISAADTSAGVSTGYTVTVATDPTA